MPLRSLLFNLIFYTLTPVWAVGLTPLLLFRSPVPLRRGIGLWTSVIFFLARAILGLRIERRGVDRLPRHTGYILAAKHQSNLDPIVTFALLPDMTALAKKELFAIPIIGALFRKLGIIRIDRQAGTAHQAMPDAARAVIDARRPLLVYPEGTRVPVGERRKLKSGAFHLQTASKLAVYPVATNSGLFWRKGLLGMRGGTVVFEIGEPVPAGLTKAAFMALLHERVVDRSDTLMRNTEGSASGPDRLDERGAA